MFSCVYFQEDVSCRVESVLFEQHALWNAELHSTGSAIEDRSQLRSWFVVTRMYRVSIQRILIPTAAAATATITRHRATTKHSLTFRVRTMLSYREVETSLLVGWLVGCLEFNLPFQHKYGYIRDELQDCNYASRYVAIATQPCTDCKSAQ